MKKLALVLALAAGGLLAANTASANVVIDHFSHGLAQEVSNDNLDRTDLDTGLPTTSVIGGARKTLLTNVTGASQFNLATLLVNDASSGNLTMSNNTGVDSRGTVVWDGGGGLVTGIQYNGIAAQDLTDAGTAFGFRFSVSAIDQFVDVTFNVWSGAQANQSTWTGQFASAVDKFFIPFANFTGSANFAAVTAMQMILDGPTAWDGAIDIVETSESIPLPGTVLLMGAGLLGLARRMKRS